MKNLSQASISEVAMVTARGIRFSGCVYSCSKAIREQWFELAHIYGGWEIQVYFNPLNLKVIYLRIDEDEIEQCNSIENQMFTGSKLEKYFHSIQQLKRQRKHPSQLKSMRGLR